MESPESSKPVTTETAPAQDSPIFSYISKFSPVHPANAPTVTQGFLGINSPPHVFTSPQLKFRSHTTFLKRAIFHGLSATTRQITKGSDVNTSANEQIESPTECPDQFFTDGMNMDSIDSNSSSGSTVKPSEYVDQPPDATGTKESSVKFDDEDIKTIIEEIAIVPPALTTQTDDVHKEDSTIYATEIETNIKHMDGTSDQCTQIEPDSSVGHALTNQELDEPITEEEKAGQGFPLDQSSHMLSGSVQVVEDSEHFVEAIGATLAKPALEEAFQHRGIRRRCLQFEDAENQLISNHPPQNHEDSTGPQSLERPLPLANEKRAVTSQPVSYPRNNLSSNFMVHGPIGLHLNKMVNYGQSGPGPIANMNPARRTGSFSICGNKLIPIINSPSDSGLSRTDDNRSLSTFSIKPLNNYVALNSAEDESTPGNKRKCNTIIDGVSEDFKSSAKKKMKSSDPNDGNGCKRCNCKKSNCLKLYCDCFAAGIYCAESCACHACLNRPQYEETVLDKRQQIESRNPLAFAPKVVKHLIQPPASSFEDDQTQFTPSSARHKRGCNCKKSMCVKRYCECYQANVGCSDGCRCEGCQNVFGRKGDHGMMKDVANDENTGERTDGSSATKFELLSSGNGLYNPELLNPHNLTPPTPAFQFSDHIKDASAAWFPSGKYFQSPSPDCNNANEIMDLVPFDPELHYDGNIQTTDNDFSAGKMDLLSGISNSQDWANDTNVQSFPVNRQYSSSSSFHWHGSPNTPMALHSGTTKLLEASMQDDTPEILKDAPTPQNNVKVISPAKKRVSPPRLHEFGSRSSGAVRTGRKFILKAVPSFPPLTPCIDSKFVAVVPTYDPQNFSNDK